MKIDVNGIQLYYTKHGTGTPLVMVHCNSMSHTIFNPAIQYLKKYYTVYALDSRGHGRSTKVDHIHYEDMAEDVYQFITKLGLEKPLYYGFSDGGIVGLILASGHPDLLSKMVMSGASLNPNSTVFRWQIMFRIMAVFDKSDQTQLMLREPDITDDMLHKITVPTVLTVGIHDMIRRSHTKHIAKEVPNAVLHTYVPYGHMGYIMYRRSFGKRLKKLLEEDV